MENIIIWREKEINEKKRTLKDERRNSKGIQTWEGGFKRKDAQI